MAERHFLEDAVGTKPTFAAEPWYNPDGDCIIYKMANEASIADRIDELLTIYRSAEDNRPIGFQIKGVAAIIQKFGLVGLAVASQTDAACVNRISIAALLLAAYEDRPFTLSRRLGYAEAMECEVPPRGSTISFAELQPA